MTSISDLCDPTAVGVGLFLVLLLIQHKKRPKSFPPGPIGLPLVGYAPFLGKNPAVTLMKLKKKYGPVMSIQMGRDTWVVLNDFATISEALIKQGNRYSDRPKNCLMEIFSRGVGLLGSDYDSTWKSLRKFGSTTLKGFGVGKKSMEVNIIEEATYLLENLESSNQKLRRSLEIATSNVISRVVFGSRFDQKDERFLRVLNVTNDTFLNSDNAKLFAVILFAPSLRHLPAIRDAINAIKKGNQVTLNIFQEFLDEHKASYVQNNLRDFIDAFLKQIEEYGDKDPSFSDEHLLQYIWELFQAGTATTASTLHWSIFTFCHFPQTQERIALEIEYLIGSSGTPTMNHRDQMPYTCAFIQEIMRLKTLAPLAFSHKTKEDSNLGGYTIPKNTIIAPNLWAVHHDPETFPEPDCFKPERFLDDNGNFVKSSHVIPFSVGPRHCLGEQLGKMEIFLFLTSIVQKFKIVPDPEFELPPYEEFSHANAISHEGPGFEANFENR